MNKIPSSWSGPLAASRRMRPHGSRRRKSASSPWGSILIDRGCAAKKKARFKRAF